MSTVAAAAQTADRIDFWIRRHVIQYCYGTHPSQSQSKFNPSRDRRVGLSAIGQCLKRIMYIQRRHWLDYDPVALAVLVIGIGMIELLALII